MRRYINMKGGFNFKGKNLHRNLLAIFWNCCYKSLQSVNKSSPFMTDGGQYEVLGSTPYNLGIGVAAIAMLSIAHSSVPLRIRK